jgi:hypothetical protein
MGVTSKCLTLLGNIMSARGSTERSRHLDASAWRFRARYVLLILWPAFVMAGVLEVLVFAAIDPGALDWRGHDASDMSASTVYSAFFLIFWAAIAMASTVTQMLSSAGDSH